MNILSLPVLGLVDFVSVAFEVDLSFSDFAFLSPYKITLVVFTQILFGAKSGNCLSDSYKKVKNIFVYMIFRTLK